MSDNGTHIDGPPVDELWILDWAAEGLAAFEPYLAKHAAFGNFLAERDGVDSGHVDGAASR